MIPLSTTAVTVLRIPDANVHDEPYDGSAEPERDVVATGIRAVIDHPGGNVQLEGGQQNVADYGLKCDPIGDSLRYSDWIKDERSGRTFRIVWFMDFGVHIEALMRDTEGEI